MVGSAWVIGGHTVQVEAGTELTGSPRVGDVVRVQGSPARNGALIARQIQGGSAAFAAAAGPETEFTGVVTSIGANQWLIGGQAVNVTPTTEIKPGVALGANVKVHASPQDDGSLVAREIELALGNANGTPSPRPDSEQEFSGALTAVAGDLWTVAGTTVRVTSATEVKGSFQIGDVLKVHAVPGLDGVLAAREIELAGADDDDDNGNDDNDDAADVAGEQEFTGVLSAINGDVWTVGGRQVRITGSTEVKGALQVGDLVKVHASPGAGGTLVAREVEPAAADDDGDDNSGSGSGSNDDDSSNSGSGSGSANDNNSGSDNSSDDDDDDDDNSGSGSGGDDNDDNSGSGNSDDDDNDNSGSGSGGSDDNSGSSDDDDD
jgi:hypothetical protein